MRCVYTRPPGLDPLPRAYCHLLMGRRSIPALIDTGADVTVIPEAQARLAGMAYVPAPRAVGVGGPVPTFVASVPLVVDLDVPVVGRRSLRWVHLGTHTIRPLIIPAPGTMTVLIGRRDILVAYAFTLIERDRIFELTPLV